MSTVATVPTKLEPAALVSALNWCAKMNPVQLSFRGTDSIAVARALNSTFGKFPMQLNKFEHEQVLVGMVAAAGDGKEPYAMLLDGLRKWGEIEVRIGE